MAKEDELRRRQTGLSTTNGPSLTASQGTLAIQVHLTALNAKIPRWTRRAC